MSGADLRRAEASSARTHEGYPILRASIGYRDTASTGAEDDCAHGLASLLRYRQRLSIDGDGIDRRHIERRNKLDNLCYTLEKTVNDNKEKIGETDVKAIHDAVAEARKALEAEDDAEIQRAIEALEKEAHRIASVMYEKASAEDGGAPPEDAPPPEPAGEDDSGKQDGKDDGVIDAEFEETN